MEILSRTMREKELRRETILNAAESLFLEKGYIDTSMNDLAAKAEYTKRTIYAYFACKEDLYFAVIDRWYGALLEASRQAVEETDTAFESIVVGCRSYVGLYKKNPVTFSLMNSIEAVRMTGAVEELPERKRLMETKANLFSLMFSIFDAAKTEGSVRTDIPTNELVASFIFNITGFFYILSSNGKNFTRYFNLDETKFIEDSVGLIVDSLRAEKEKQI